jgi:hypothetical protein
MASEVITPGTAKTAVEEKLPQVHNFIMEQTAGEVNWVEIHEDLTALFWLEPVNPVDIIEPVWDIVDLCANGAASGNPRFRILKINRVKLRVNELIYQLTNARDGNTECVYKCK